MCKGPVGLHKHQPALDQPLLVSGRGVNRDLPFGSLINSLTRFRGGDTTPPLPCRGGFCPGEPSLPAKTLPDLGGRTFESFTILWRKAGTTDYTDVLAFYNPGTTTTINTGLKNGTTYEFALAVNAGGEVSEQGLATATPHGDIGTVDRNPDETLVAKPTANKPRYWERKPYSFGDCTKYEVADDFGSVWDLVGGASALILKSDRINDVWVDPMVGLYGTASAKDISHAIVCYDQP